MNKPLDMPDGPGWWGGVQSYREFVVHFTEFTVTDDAAFVRWAEDDYTMRYPIEQFKRTYQDVKWYRLTMPWEQPHPAITPAIKDNIGLCAAAVVLAYYRKTHDHILQDNEILNAALNVERWLGRR